MHSFEMVGFKPVFALAAMSVSVCMMFVWNSALMADDVLDIQRKLQTYIRTAEGHLALANLSAQMCGPSRIAFVIPYYKESVEALKQTSLSIVRQRNFNWIYTIIISDDGSPEPSRPHAVVDWLRNEIGLPRCCSATVLRGTNGMLPVTRNRAFQTLPPQVEWVVPIDAGDRLNNTFLDLSVRAVQDQPSLNLIHPHLCTEKGYQWDPPNIHVAKTPLHKANLFHCCPMFRRSLWERVGGYDASFTFGWEDWDFWVRANQTVGLTAKNLPERCMYLYHPGESHATCVDNEAQCKAAFKTAHGNLNSAADILEAHRLLLQSPKFLRNNRLESQHSKFPDRALMWLWYGMLQEAEGNSRGALEEYYGAISRDMEANAGQSTRGVAWQAAYRGAEMLQQGRQRTQLRAWCKRVIELLVRLTKLHSTGERWKHFRELCMSPT
mmetsp:Transcript_42554/g.120377  ORF Transcript_42554/g.120377 Transcript_42554/m.120377 type:complete len:438 (-) Transcript_42554:221-1534(-)